MGAAPTPDKCISVSNNGIILGKKVANYFKSKGVSFVNIILNYNNNSLIIKDTGIRENRLINNKEQGLRITYEQHYKRNTSIKLNQLIRFLDTDYVNIYKAKPFKEDSVIVENIPFRDQVILRCCIVNIRIKSKLIFFGNLKQFDEINLKDITPIPSSIQNNLTSTPSQSKIQSTQSTSTLSQSKTSTKPVADRRYDPNEVSKIDDENSPLSEAQERANKEYSKMILGE